jgi:hypothetical protein
MQTTFVSSLALFLAIGTVSAAPLTTIEVSKRATAQCPITGPSTIGAYTYMGCMTEATSSRTLDLARLNQPYMTLELCATFCESQGYPLMGTEYSTECYCGTYPRGDAISISDAQCNMPCGEDPSEMCGAGSRLSVYAYSNYTAPVIPTIPGYTYKGCYTEPSNTRALGSASYVDYDGMTVEMCQSFCSGKGYSMFGIEYEGECWCANSLASGSALAPAGDTECHSTCPGDYTQLACGAASRLNVYKKV